MDEITAAFEALEKELALFRQSEAAPDVAIELARVKLAEAALGLARAALEGSEQAAAIDNTLAYLRGQVAEWRHLGRGWFDDRMIKKTFPNLVQVRDEQGNPVYLRDRNGELLRRRGRLVPELTIDPANPTYNRYFGPYRYFRWYEAGKPKTRYLGKVSELEARAQEGQKS